MTEQILVRPQTRPASYPSRLLDGLKLWNEARRAAKLNNALFIWIPKNAGTSVYTMLRKFGLVKLKTPRAVRLCFRNSGRVTFGHMSIGSLLDFGLLSPEFVDRAFKFAFTRDPYGRAVSLYRYHLKTVCVNWHERPEFRDFLRVLADGHYDRIGLYNERGLSQCNPQIEWLRDASPDRIYRVEDIGEFVADISDRWGIPQSDVPHLNRSSVREDIELTREEKAMIERIYAEDFETFAYAKG